MRLSSGQSTVIQTRMTAISIQVLCKNCLAPRSIFCRMNASEWSCRSDETPPIASTEFLTRVDSVARKFHNADADFDSYFLITAS